MLFPFLSFFIALNTGLFFHNVSGVILLSKCIFKIFDCKSKKFLIAVAMDSNVSRKGQGDPVPGPPSQLALKL